MSAMTPTWTAERIEVLKTRVEAGYSCRQIADEIGVSRNAVIGKISRLKLSRPLRSRPSPAREVGTKVRPATFASKNPFRMALHAVQQLSTDEASDANRCSLLELSKEKCRWPICNADAVTLSFCGNMPVEGFPYCAGHTRIAYRLPKRGSSQTLPTTTLARHVRSG